MSVINSFTQHTINLTRKALRLGSDFVHPVHDDTPDEPDYLSNADVPVETNIALPHSDDWDDGHLTVTDIDPATGLLTTSTEGNPPLDEGTSIYDLYADRAERMGDEPLYTYKSGNDWVTVTANEFLADVRAVAKGLIHYGLKKGDAVAFMCRTSYDWDLTDAAIMACGGVLATIYDTDSAEQIRNIVNNSDARLLIVQDTDMREKADGAVEECPSLEHIITIETGGLDEIKAYGTGISDEELDERIDSVKKTDLCSIVYTSGSTAAPKGVEMTHEHYCQTALNLPTYMPELLHDKKNTILLFLPQAHSFARAINYIVVASNVHIYIASRHQDADQRPAGGQAVHHDRGAACAGEGVQRRISEGRTRSQGRGVRLRRGGCAELYEGSLRQWQGRCTDPHSPRCLRSDCLLFAARSARRSRQVDCGRRCPA